jgi:hypothetical protein
VPNAPAPKPERTFCSNCGFPVRGSRCEACGAPQEPQLDRDFADDVPTKQTQFRPYTSELDTDLVGLERAVDAYRNKDTSRFVEQLVFIEGAGTARTAPQSDGSGWIVTVRGGLVFVTLRLPTDEMTLESPIARLPSRQRLPAMRLALELCARDAPSSRVCLRGDLLLLRFTARASQMTPAALRHYLREIGHLGSRYAGLFIVGLDALPAVADEVRSSAGFEVLGRSRKVQLVAGASIRRSIPPPVGAPPLAAASPYAAPPTHGTDRARAEAPHAPHPPPPPPNPPRTQAIPPPRPQRHEDVAPAPDHPAQDAIPAVLSPMFSAPASQPSYEPPPPAIPAPPPVPVVRPRPAPAPEPVAAVDAGQKRNQTGAGVTDPRRSGPNYDGSLNAPKPRPPAEPQAPLELSGINRPASSPNPPGEPVASTGSPALSPSDRLCMLLRQAQSLGSLTLEERPASMMWLVRSTVFRAVYDFKDTLPDAVAHLYRCTGIGKDAPGGTGRSQAMTAQEPALNVFERVIVARAAVAKEKTLVLEPMVSAAQAKEHVSRYLAEIEKSPAEPSLRHFLGLGALTELLVRTKLPPQTDQRLRDIVAHAQREGAKQTAIDLMMTALQRINS